MTGKEGVKEAGEADHRDKTAAETDLTRRLEKEQAWGRATRKKPSGSAAKTAHWRLQRRLTGEEHTLLLQRTGAQSPAPTRGSSQPPATSLPGDPTPSSGLPGACEISAPARRGHQITRNYSSSHVGAGNYTWVLCKSNRCHLLVPKVIFTKRKSVLG